MIDGDESQTTAEWEVAGQSAYRKQVQSPLCRKLEEKVKECTMLPQRWKY